MFNWYKRRNDKDDKKKEKKGGLSSPVSSSSLNESAIGFFDKFVALCEEFNVSLDNDPHLRKCAARLAAFDLDPHGRKEIVDSYIEDYNNWTNVISGLSRSHPDLSKMQALSTQLADFNQQLLSQIPSSPKHGKP